eukprot:TRINITY_DN33054_c0_g1_i1.p2 TRINITY_DN33054_c0_g1~~TRINITY_DN33054_c0_g1_i1.p2  ORF type:complete len:365 (+),score=97.39 TRINITY_DN33054_c0_g1_i1:76-1095(+)
MVAATATTDGIEWYPYAFSPPAGQTRGCRDYCTGGTMVPVAGTACIVLTLLTYVIGVRLRSTWKPELSTASRERLRKATVRKLGLSADSVLPDSVVAEEQRSIAQFAALGCVGAPFWLVLGPTCLAMAVTYQLRYDPGAPENFQNDPLIFDAEGLRYHNFATLMGELFLGYTLYMTVMWLWDWDTGVDTIIHHVAFIALAWLQVSAASLCAVGQWAIAMETSTPPLWGYLVFRQIAGKGGGDHPIGEVAKPVFGVLFILLRVIGFGYGLITCCIGLVSHWDTVFPGKPHSITVPAGMTVFVLMFVGWALQLYWGALIVAKFRSKKEKKPAERPQYGSTV